MKEKFVWFMFAAMGLLFAVIGVFVTINTFNYENTAETTAVITDIERYRDSDGDTSYDVWVEYMVDGNVYEAELNVYASSFRVGKEIDIYYDIYDYGRVGVKSLDFIVLLFPVMGLLFFVIGLFGLTSGMRRKKKENGLRQTGQRINANYVETIYNTSYSVNGRHPYIIVCEWDNPSDYKKYIFKSKNLWENPEYIINERGITTFPVYINMNNMKKYFMDIEEVESAVVEL